MRQVYSSCSEMAKRKHLNHFTRIYDVRDYTDVIVAGKYCSSSIGLEQIRSLYILVSIVIMVSIIIISSASYAKKKQLEWSIRQHFFRVGMKCNFFILFFYANIKVCRLPRGVDLYFNTFFVVMVTVSSFQNLYLIKNN